MAVCLAVCLSVWLAVCLSGCLSISVSVNLSSVCAVSVYFYISSGWLDVLKSLPLVRLSHGEQLKGGYWVSGWTDGCVDVLPGLTPDSFVRVCLWRLGCHSQK